MNLYSKKLETLLAVNLTGVLLFLLFKEKWLLIVPFVISLASLIFPAFLSAVHIVWSVFFSFLGSLNSKILLSIVFILILVPIAFIKNIFVKKPSVDTGADNTYKVRNHLFVADDFNRMG